MEFIIGFPKIVRQHDSIMVIMDMLTKVAHFIRVKSTFSASDVARVFIRDVVRLNGIPKKIVSDKDVKFTSKFWKELFTGHRVDLQYELSFVDRQRGSTRYWRTC